MKNRVFTEKQVWLIWVSALIAGGLVGYIIGVLKYIL